MLVEVARSADHLDRRCCVAGPGVNEPAALTDVGGEQPPATDEVVDHLPWRLRRVESAARRRLEIHRIERVIHQMRTDVGIVHDRGDPVFGQMVGRTDARNHQKLWRVNRAGRQNDFPFSAQQLSGAAPLHLDADRTPLRDAHAEDVRLGEHREVRPPAGRH
jgi:hypothetical protein